MIFFPQKKKVPGKMLLNKVWKAQSPWYITLSEVQSSRNNSSSARIFLATSAPPDVGEVRSFTWQCHMVNIQMAQLSDFH